MGNHPYCYEIEEEMEGYKNFGISINTIQNIEMIIVIIYSEVVMIYTII